MINKNLTIFYNFIFIVTSIKQIFFLQKCKLIQSLFILNTNLHNNLIKIFRYKFIVFLNNDHIVI